MTQDFKDQNALLVDGQLVCRHFLFRRCVKAGWTKTLLPELWLGVPHVALFPRFVHRKTAVSCYIFRVTTVWLKNPASSTSKGTARMETAVYTCTISFHSASALTSLHCCLLFPWPSCTVVSLQVFPPKREMLERRELQVFPRSARRRHRKTAERGLSEALCVFCDGVTLWAKSTCFYFYAFTVLKHEKSYETMRQGKEEEETETKKDPDFPTEALRYWFCFDNFIFFPWKSPLFYV